MKKSEISQMAAEDVIGRCLADFFILEKKVDKMHKNIRKREKIL